MCISFFTAQIFDLPKTLFCSKCCRMATTPKGCIIVAHENQRLYYSAAHLFSSCATFDPMGTALAWAWHAEDGESRHDVFHQNVMISNMCAHICHACMLQNVSLIFSDSPSQESVIRHHANHGLIHLESLQHIGREGPH